MNAFPEESFLFADDLTSEERKALRDALAADPALARTFRRVQAARALVRERLADALPDRGLLVLYALYTSPTLADSLSDTERATVAQAHPHLQAAIERHPALATVVARIQEEALAFEAAWEAAMESTSGVAHGSRPRTRSTRTAQSTRAAESPGRSQRAPSRPPRPQRNTTLRWVMRGGVAITLLLFAVASFLIIQRDRGMVTVETGPGEMRQVALGNGSTVRLFEASRLTYAAPSRTAVLKRRTHLTGRGFFDIRPGTSPFTVETPTAQATVLGTRFGLTADTVGTEVVVASGAVAIASRQAPSQPVRVEAGQVSRVVAGALPTTPVTVDLSVALSEMGLFAFRATPLEQALHQLARAYDVTLRADEALLQEAVTGTFYAADDLRIILDALAATLNAAVETTPDGYRLTQK